MDNKGNDIMNYMRNVINQYNYNDITGAKVKINVDRILGRPGSLSTKYTKFLEDNKDKVFTVMKEVDTPYSTFYSLVEDNSVPKWMFQLEDLIVVMEDGTTLRGGSNANS